MCALVSSCAPETFASSKGIAHMKRGSSQRMSSLFGQDYGCGSSDAVCQVPVHGTAAAPGARQRCAADPRCDVLVLNLQRTTGTLKAAFNWSKQTYARNTLTECRRVAAELRARLTCSRPSLVNEWYALGCDDYTHGASWGYEAADGTALAASARSSFAAAARAAAASGAVPRPLANTSSTGGRSGRRAPVLVTAFANGRGAGYDRLAESAKLLNVSLSTLGWEEPRLPVRWHEYYLGSKIVTTLILARSVPPETVLISVDGSDVLLQRGIGAIARAAHHLLRHSDIVFGAEAHCYHCDGPLHRRHERLAAAWAATQPQNVGTHTAKQLGGGRGKGVAAPPTAALPAARYLNGGCLAARAGPLASFLQRYLEIMSGNQKLFGVAEASPLLAHAKRTLYKRDTPRVYHSTQQATLTRLLFAGAEPHAAGRHGGNRTAPQRAPPADGASWRASLDYGSRLCWNMFSSSPQKTMAWQPDGLLRVRSSGHAPPIVHYNGGISTAKLDWMEGYDAERLLANVRRRAGAKAHGAAKPRPLGHQRPGASAAGGAARQEHEAHAHAAAAQRRAPPRHAAAGTSSTTDDGPGGGVLPYWVHRKADTSL